MRALFGRECGLVSLDGDAWEDPKEAGVMEPLNSNESLWPVAETSTTPRGSDLPTLSGSNTPTPGASAFPPLSEGINPALPEKTVVASPETLAMQDRADSSQDLPSPLPLVSRFITRLKSQQASKAEVQSLTQEEVCYTSKELIEFSD